MQHGDRWKRPGGKSLSIFVKEGRSFHHSSNDPLNDGYWHRSFDVFCELEHGGDCRAAVKAAAELLGLKFSDGPYDAPDQAGIEAEQAATKLPRIPPPCSLKQLVSDSSDLAARGHRRAVASGRNDEPCSGAEGKEVMAGQQPGAFGNDRPGLVGQVSM